VGSPCQADLADIERYFRLVATLGSKSTLKKVTRKAILDVNVPKACDVIVDPAAPMALRLQGNLLSVIFYLKQGSELTTIGAGMVFHASILSNAAMSLRMHSWPRII